MANLNLFLSFIQYGQTNEDHPQIYPSHLDNLLGKEFDFCVEYQPDYKQSSVVKLIEDKQIIQMITYAMVQLEVFPSFYTFIS